MEVIYNTREKKVNSCPFFVSLTIYDKDVK